MAQPDLRALMTPEARTWFAGAGLALKSSYRVDEIASLLDVSRRTVYSMIERGGLDVIRDTGGLRRSPTRIPLCAVVSLLDAPD